MDRAWWDRHIKQVRSVFRGELAAPLVNCHGIQRSAARGGNSGAGAILLAAEKGAKRVLLLGYDCQRTNAKVHWHGDHPKGLGNAGSMKHWPAHFGKVRAAHTDLEIINCSRETALRVFPRAALEDVL